MDPVLVIAGDEKRNNEEKGQPGLLYFDPSARTGTKKEIYEKGLIGLSTPRLAVHQSAAPELRRAPALPVG